MGILKELKPHFICKGYGIFVLSFFYYSTQTIYTNPGVFMRTENTES
jgi:hypothetical protein